MHCISDFNQRKHFPEKGDKKLHMDIEILLKLCQNITV